ncbi:MAG TPA: flagellin [Rickettsiales bacterium]|nr:flagellin [Rickettsiales bacterium]
MSISSLSNNIAALVAQLNIGTATTNVQNNVTALSSGSRIVSAATDVAALSTGTALSAQVNSINTALSVSSQASSLLQVADGALSQIQTIIQRQQTIAASAQSGSLTDTQRGFLDQEFQNLSSQIDQLANSTTFNGVNLINGNISGKIGFNTNTTDSTAAANASAGIMTLNGSVANGDTVTIDGVTVTFSSSAQGTTAAAGKVVIGNNATGSAANLVAYLNNLNAPQFANLTFHNTAGVITANYTGGTLLGTQKITSSTSDTTNITGTGSANVSATTTPTTTNADGLSVDRYTTFGSVTGSLLVNGDKTATNYGAAIDVSSLKNNASFIGNFGGDNISSISATYSGTAGKASFTVSAGGITYTTGVVDLTTTAAPIVATFTGADSTGTAKGGSFTLSFNATTAQTFASQSQLDGITSQLNQALAGVSVQQNRTVSGITTGNVVTVGGVQVANLQGISAQFKSSDFSNPTISSITVAAPGTGSTDAKITAVINGHTFTSVSGIGTSIGLNTVIALQDTSDPSQTFSLVTGNTAIATSTTTALDISSSDKASAIQDALQKAFGIDKAGASLKFQAGAASTDTIGVSIGSATTSSLFGGKSLDVKTLTDATNAAGVLDTALNTVTSLRATVGALEERFSYASNALQSAAQNEGAAKSNLLDTDVAATSTSFATSQVQLQAGIAVLANANQLQQSLLKLIQ